MNKQQKTTSARAFYQRGILILDLPAAREPMLWRQEIKNISGLTFSTHILSDNTHALVLRVSDPAPANAGGAEQIIATFDNVAAADDALAALRGIFIRPRRGNRLRAVLKFLAIIFVLWLTLRFGVHLGQIAEPDKPADHTAAEGVTTPTPVPSPTASMSDTHPPLVATGASAGSGIPPSPTAPVSSPAAEVGSKSVTQPAPPPPAPSNTGGPPAQ